MNKEKVLNLAKLARIEIGDEEAESLSHEFDAILGYVGEVRNVTNIGQSMFNESMLHNVMREDSQPHESGRYTKKILEQAPAREGEYIKVKKIL
ncbi:MAG: Asp-tRNA(Asn)/Glu-tRNA(Gln) amidotransferase subunit GatC [bacterium]|nr:Asp-tRNA(Asn)/Glu-tRNA(Gln) amidotransferase subunit GatC [bacterium]